MHFPFDEYMRSGLGRLNLSPDIFWKMTMKEFWSMYHGKFGKPDIPLGKDDLKRMMEKYPDGNVRRISC